MSELVARETYDYQAFVLIFLIQRLEPVVLRILIDSPGSTVIWKVRN